MPHHASITMTKGVKSKKPVREVKKLSLKYQGIAQTTRKRYEAQLKIFFHYLSLRDVPLPSTWRRLDRLVADYIDHMFQEGAPVGYAGDLLSGLSRWMPGSRNNMPTARLWFRDWCRDVVRKRALPIPVFALNGLAGIALAMDRLDLAVLLPVGFVCMLRTCEIYSLKKEDIMFNPSGKTAIIALQQTKTSGPNTEEAVVYDQCLVNGLRRLCSQTSAGKPLYSRPAKFLGEDLRWLGSLVGFSHNRFTPYSLRRGGATWHMHTYGSLSTTALLGRWKQERTAKIYIDGAAAEWASWQFDEKAQALLKSSSKIFRKTLAR